MAGKKGMVNNPNGKGGFAERPQDRNPGGFTKAQKEQHKINRDRALALEDRILTALEADGDGVAIREMLSGGDILRLIHTAIERYDGKPKQAVDLSSEDGSMSPKGRDLRDFYKDVSAKPGPE